MRGWRVGGQLGLWARKTIQMREHRTEVTEATEGDGGCAGGWLAGQHGLWARKTIQMREHRTEVTEATEGDGGCAGGGLVDSMASGRERRSTSESIARRSRRPREGWGMRGWRVGGQLGLWARKTIQMREHRTEVTEATEGDGECAGGGLVRQLGRWASSEELTHRGDTDSGRLSLTFSPARRKVSSPYPFLL